MYFIEKYIKNEEFESDMNLESLKSLLKGKF